MNEPHRPAPSRIMARLAPPFKSRLFGAALSLLAGLLLGAGLVAHGIWVKLHHSLPVISGRIALDGLDAPVDILRDAQGVPHIFADNLHDAYFAEGFVHAQDRLWQMEFTRRLGQGRVAELIGAGALKYDRLFRALDLAGAARRTYETLPQKAKDALIAYADGVNAFLVSNTRPLPPEFFLLGLRTDATPAPWQPADSVLMIKLLAFQLSTNAFSEIETLKLLTHLTPEELASFEGGVPVLPSVKDLYGFALHAARGSPLPLLGASNNWAVSGNWTKSGTPLLANDTHLGLTLPNVFYLVHVNAGSKSNAPPVSFIGASAPGVPGILLGQTDRLAWGYTNTGADVQDFFLERSDLTDSSRYLTPNGPEKFTTREETIKVLGGRDVHETFYATRHGPILPADTIGAEDVLPKGYALALQWTALDPDDATIAAGLDILHAQTGAEFREAMRGYVAPMQSMVYADADGDFGLVVPGRAPLRAPENTTHGLIPAPGWKEGFDWQGFVTYDALPHRDHPLGGYVVTANNDITPTGYTPVLSYEFDNDSRARRIEDLLAARRDHDPETFRVLQQDTVSLWARALFPLMRDAMADSPPGHPLAGKALQALGAWDGDMRGNRPAPLIFAAWLRETMKALYGDELGDAFPSAWGWRFDLLNRALTSDDGAEKWCDVRQTPKIETCGAQLAAALDTALASLARDHGNRVDTWAFEDTHRAVFAHRPFGNVPVLGDLFNRSIPTPGGADTINRGVTAFGRAHPFQNVHAATYRGIYDLGAPEKSLFIIPAGESGNPLSPHYDDLTPLWASGAYLPMITHRAAIEAAGASRLTLAPKG